MTARWHWTAVQDPSVKLSLLTIGYADLHRISVHGAGARCWKRKSIDLDYRWSRSPLPAVRTTHTKRHFSRTLRDRVVVLT